ncbi:MAG: hypothetical protein ACJAT1_001664 [Marivirga sp.]|jgi:hypothetical protein
MVLKDAINSFCVNKSKGTRIIYDSLCSFIDSNVSQMTPKISHAETGHQFDIIALAFGFKTLKISFAAAALFGKNC